MTTTTAQTTAAGRVARVICPVVDVEFAADKVLAKTDPAAAKNPLIFPTPTMLKQLHQFDPKALFNPDYKTKWQKLLGA